MNEKNFIDDLTSEGTPDTSEDEESATDDDILVEDSEDDSKTWKPHKRKKEKTVNVKQEGTYISRSEGNSRIEITESVPQVVMSWWKYITTCVIE